MPDRVGTQPEGMGNMDAWRLQDAVVTKLLTIALGQDGPSDEGFRVRSWMKI
jgi:hypothetical protein